MSLLSKPITAERVREETPDIYAAIKAEGVAEAEKKVSEGLPAQLEAVRAKTEADTRASLKEIMDQASTDQKLMAVDLFLAGKTKAEATEALLKNAQETKAQALKDFGAGAAALLPPDGENTTGLVEAAAKFDKDPALQKAYKAKGGRDAYVAALKEWTTNKELSAKFAGNIDSFLAFRRNTKEEVN